MREIFNVELVLKDKSHEEKDDEPLAKGEESGQPQEEPETSPRGDNEDVDCSIDSCVALTFDDGPSIYTDKLLDILKENEVKATFFVLGRSAKIQGNTIRRMVAEGHDIGNHSYDHKNLKTLDEEGIAFQIKESSELIARLSDYQVELLRPPYGAYNQEVVDMVNMPIILWSIDPEDWKDRDKDLVLARMSEAKSGDIILAHDIYPTTIEAIPELIATLKAKGLVFVSISDLVGAHNLKPGAVIRARGLIM